MGKDDKLNLIIMRDDSRVRRYRVRVSWFKLFLYAQVILLTAAVLGAYGGFSYWIKNMALAQANAGLEEKLLEAQIQLERLQNVEKILQSNDSDEIQGLFSTVSRGMQDTAPQPLDLQDIFVAKDLQMAGVNNLQVRKAGEGLRLSFELNNLADGTLTGETSVFFIARDASILQARGEENELSFEIQRFRRVSSMLHFPPGLAMEDVFAMRLVIENSEGESLFIQTYPLANILTS